MFVSSEFPKGRNVNGAARSIVLSLTLCLFLFGTALPLKSSRADPLLVSTITPDVQDGECCSEPLLQSGSRVVESTEGESIESANTASKKYGLDNLRKSGRVWSLASKTSIWGRSGVDLRHDGSMEDTRLGRGILTWQGDWTGPRGISARASLRADIITGADGSRYEDQDVGVWEAFVRVSRPTWDVTLGRQIIRWGKADEISPVDLINPQDLRELIFLRREERKRPIFLTRARWHTYTHTFEMVWSPRAEGHKRDYFDTDWAVFGHLKESAEQDPGLPLPAKQFISALDVDEEASGWELRDSEIAFRVTGTTGSLDYGMNILYTHDRGPYPAIRAFRNSDLLTDDPTAVGLSAMEPSIPSFQDTSIHVGRPRDTLVGFELETTLGDYGFRAEAAYHTDRVFLTKAVSSIRKEYIQVILGADRLWDNRLYVNLQFLQQYLPGWEEDILFDPRLDSACLVRFSWPFRDEMLEFRFDGTYSVTTRAWFANPEFQWKPRDNVRIFTGIHLLYGPKGTFFDLYDKNDQIYIGAEFVF